MGCSRILKFLSRRQHGRICRWFPPRDCLANAKTGRGSLAAEASEVTISQKHTIMGQDGDRQAVLLESVIPAVACRRDRRSFQHFSRGLVRSAETSLPVRCRPVLTEWQPHVINRGTPEDKAAETLRLIKQPCNVADSGEKPHLAFLCHQSSRIEQILCVE